MKEGTPESLTAFLAEHGPCFEAPAKARLKAMGVTEQPAPEPEPEVAEEPAEEETQDEPEQKAEAPAPTPTAGNLVSASDPDSVVNAFQEYGLATKRDTDSVGDPMLTTKMNGLNVTVYFYGCDDNKNCQTLQFVVRLNDEGATDVNKTNVWNDEKLYGRAYIDDGIVVFDLVQTSVVDMPKEAFANVIEQFDDALSDFLELIDW